jgi:hypothetical protein
MSPGLKGPPVFYNTRESTTSRASHAIRKLLTSRLPQHKPFTIDDMERIPAGRLFAAREARRDALQGMDGKRSERRKSTRHDRALGPDPHEGHRAGRASTFDGQATGRTRRKARASQVTVPRSRRWLSKACSQALARFG